MNRVTGDQERERVKAHSRGRILTRPGQVRPILPRPTTGLHALGLGKGRDGVLYVPTGYEPDHPAPLVLMLHGAGGEASHGLAPFLPLADAAGLILLAPDARRATWDVIRGGYGPDVAFIDRCLAHTFARCTVDTGHLAIAGFSDGASYALSLGLTNGDLFTHVIAFSPGFMAPAAPEGMPSVYVTHGVGDEVLPIDVCSRRLVPRLRQAGYEVQYREFAGPHTVPPEVASDALAWFRGDSPATVRRDEG